MSFGIANNVKSKVRVCTPELFREAIESQVVADVCAQIKDALEAVRRGEMSPEDFETLKGNLKKALIIFTFHATFKNGRRKNDEAIPSGLSIYDLDHIPNPEGRWVEIESRKEELGIVLAHVTPSSEGLRLVFVMPQGMTLAEAQAWMARQIGDEKYDACVKDYARCSFVVPQEYVLFVDEDALFSLNSPQSTQSFTEDSYSASDASSSYPFNPVILSEAKNLEDTQEDAKVDAQEILPPFGRQNDKKEGRQDDKKEEAANENKENNLCKSVQSVVKEEKSVVKEENAMENQYPETYEGIPYTDLVQTLEEQMGGQPEHGSRNNFIFSMACHLRYVCNDDAQWIARILPTYGEARDKWMATIRSACARSQTKSIPRIMRRTLKICKERKEEESDVRHQTSDINLPPPMPRKIPALVKLCIAPQPDIYKAAVSHAIFPALGAHCKGVSFRYIDNVLHEPTLSCVLSADTGAGKNCVNMPIDQIMADIRRRDAENMRREKEWKMEMSTKGANKDKRARPEGLVIQEVDADMTNAAFVQRMADADGHFLYTKLNEIDQFDALKTSARSKAHFQIMCLAFDPGNLYGQTRASVGSICERVCIRFNWNASTTVRKLRAYFRSVLTDGPISRINFCTIPQREIGAEIPVFGSYDEEFAEKLRPYIERLNAAKGVIDCPQARKLARKLVEECADFARLSQSRVYENLSFRACVIAYLKAMVLYVAHDYRWDKSIEDFVRWSLQYDMWCKMYFFGEAIEEQEREERKVVNKGPQNLLDLLPDVFTREEANAMMRRMGVKSDTAAIICNWKRRGYIETYGEEKLQTQVEQQRYAKTEEYLKKHASPQ